MRSTFAFLALCACYSPTYVDCEVTCGNTTVCPSGLLCNPNGYCVADMSVSCTGGGDGGLDAAPDASLPTGPWSAPQPVQFGGMITNVDDDPTLTDDMLEMWVQRTTGAGQQDIFSVRRATINDPWGPVNIVMELSSATIEDTPEVSGDGLTIYFARGSATDMNVHVATRASRTAAWGVPTQVSPVNSATNESGSAISRDGLTLVLVSARNNTNDLWQTNRPMVTSAFNMPSLITFSNPNVSEESPFLSTDKQTLYYSSAVSGNHELYMAMKTGSTFFNPTPISELNVPTGDDSDPWVSPDGRTMYFARTISGQTTIMRATR